ncbi:MAG: DEAD/DEAH box helicase [Candidatus Nanoarchaeia archaeon]|jgi:ATP-dependent RNA helicase DeaD|nr:DEAD/DEAH box helicase [Candidatus Nanoarchaeia archaeon]|tara:strand:+ start:40587 stop:41903 length:1317 start_codon:yes stop_codon:yes gene_type:complete
MKFEDFKLDKDLLKNINDLKFVEPTQIQEKSIPHILEGKDVVGESATGSGKTLAFGCGVLKKVSPKKGLQGLILTPTRELAEQVKESIKNLARHTHLNIISIYGGVDIKKQIYNLPKAEIVIATPGRLLDHLKRKTVDLSKVNILVLDECDRMFDMGFKEDIEQIIRKCPKERQSLFFSATISSEIKKLANNYSNNPIRVSAKIMVDPEKLKQVYYNTPRNMKLSLLVQLLEMEKSGLVMVFCNTRRNVDFVVKNLKVNNIKAIAIHGGMAQNKRNNTIEMFNGNKFGVLVCTDVAARGLHIDNVSHIYNYDIPRDPKDYVHRIGRTARAGEEGKVVNLLAEDHFGNFSLIKRNYPNFDIKKMGNIHVKKIKSLRTDNFQKFGSRGRSNFRRSNSRGNFRRNNDRKDDSRRNFRKGNDERNDSRRFQRRTTTQSHRRR